MILNLFYRYMDNVKSDEDISYIKDMLSISFQMDTVLVYRKSQDVRATIPKVLKHSFFMVFDEENKMLLI